jgi:hypothetical protein
MQGITYDDIIPGLLKIVPEFPQDEEDIRDGLTYLVFADLMRFVKCQLEMPDKGELLQRIFDYIEEIANTEDARALDLLRDSFHELVTLPDVNKLKKYLGKHSQKLLREVNSQVYS